MSRNWEFYETWIQWPPYSAELPCLLRLKLQLEVVKSASQEELGFLQTAKVRHVSDCEIGAQWPKVPQPRVVIGVTSRNLWLEKSNFVTENLLRVKGCVSNEKLVSDSPYKAELKHESPIFDVSNLTAEDVPQRTARRAMRR